MTVLSKPAVTTSGTATTRRQLTPPIPLVRPPRSELQRGEYQTYKLRNVPTDDKSPTYELAVPYFGTGTCEEWLLFRKNLTKVLTGQNVTTGPASYIVGRRLLEGDALATFNNAAETKASETVDTFKECIEAVNESIFPRRAVLLQRRYMRRFIRKPNTMTTREYVARLTEINGYLPLFPPVKEGEAHPTALPQDEIVDLLEYGVPNSWQRSMILQDFNPLQHTVTEFVQFCERLEQVEANEGRGQANSTDQKPKASKAVKGNKHNNENKLNKKRKSPPDQSGGCMLHGENCGHVTDDCFTLKAQAKRMKGTWDAQTR